MPNWCNNDIHLFHEDKEMINRAEAALKEDKFFSEFLPCPKELSNTVSGCVEEGYARELHEFQKELNLRYFGHKDWYDWTVNNWGTKWEVCEACVTRVSENALTASYDTAWSPPIAFYEKLQELGFIVKAFYYEPGMAFCGSWDDGDDCFYDIDGNSDWVEENIPSEIDQAFCISQGMAEWEEENQEIDLDNGLSATNEQEKA